MKFALLLVSVFLVSSSVGTPLDTDLLLRQRRDVNYIGNAQALVENLIHDLQSSGQQALDAVQTFSAGIQDQRNLFAEKLINDIQGVRDRVQFAFKSISDRFVNAGSDVRDCIDSHQNALNNVFNNAAVNSKECAGDRIKEIGNMVDELRELSSEMTNYTRNSVAELRECTESDQGLLATGTCLGGIAVRTQLKGAVYVTQSAVLASRINLGFSTLPAALEVCAGTKLVEAGIYSAKVVMEVGTCSASSVYSFLMGNNSS